MAEIYWTKDLKEFSTELTKLIEQHSFLDDDDDTYMSDLQVVMPILFEKAINANKANQGKFNGYANIPTVRYQLDWQYEGKGTLREWYPDAFKR